MPSSGHILLTGANGYIGRRLLQKLLDKGYYITCLVRDKRRFEVKPDQEDQIQVVEGDLLKPETLKNLPSNIDGAYFLVHSMSASYSDFEEMEAQTAQNFKNYLDRTTCQQVIFLSGIMNDQSLSRHFKSRLNVEKILQGGQVPVTTLRAPIIIGSGSASFEIMRDLVNKLPVMVATKWLNNRIQPIALRDVLYYLSSTVFLEASYHKTFDIGGPEILTYKAMLIKMGQVKGKNLRIFILPVLTPKLSAYWLYFVTATSFSLARSLVESLKHEVVVKKTGIEKLLPASLTTFEDAVKKAYARIDQNLVDSSWKDSMVSGTINANFLDKEAVPETGGLYDEQWIPVRQSIEQVKTNIWQIGGQNGWYYMDWAWEIRGLIDKIVGGVGLRRGRRSPESLVKGDALDFWRVLKADWGNGYLLLYAEMKLPGEAWLEFSIETDENPQYFLKQKATFLPYGFLGKMYWYSLLPFHFFIFKGMAEQVAHKQFGHVSKFANSG